MNRVTLAALFVLAAFIGGGLLQRALFEPPPTQLAMARARDAWVLPADGSWLGSADAFWTGARPLGAPPTPPPPPPPPPPPVVPPAVPAGVVVGADGRYESIFLDPILGEVRLKAGDRMPQGGRVTRITRTAVEWVDGKGTRYRHAMLADPPPFSTYAKGYAPPMPPGDAR